MERLSNDLRQRYLAVSGGWLGSLVIVISKTLGIWDPLVLSVVIILAYVIVRTCAPPISLVLGLYFDAVIPLQYWCDEGSYRLHQNHLDDYWPLFGLGMLVEIAALVLMHPHVFTLVACLKTIGLTGVWMGRKENGVFWSSALRQGQRASASTIPVGGVHWVAEAVPPAVEINPGGTPGTDHSSNAAPAAPPLRAFRSNTAYRADEAPPPFPNDPRYPNAEELLRANYPDPWTRWGMLNELAGRYTEANATQALEQWVNTPATTARADKYAERAHQAALMFQYARATAGGSAAPLSLAAFPTDPRHPDAEPQLRGLYPDPWARWGMLYELRAQKNSTKADEMLSQWSARTSRTAAARCAAEAKRIIWAGQPGASGRSSESGHSDHLPPPPRPNLPAGDLDQLRLKYADKTTQWGMLNHLAKDPETAESSLASWLKQPASRTRAEKYAAEARAAIKKGDQGEPVKPPHPRLMRPDSPIAGDDGVVGLDLEKADRMLVPLYPDALVRKGMIESYRSIADDAEAEKMIRRVARESEPEALAARTEVYRPRGLAAQAWEKELHPTVAVAKVPLFVEPREIEWNRQLRKVYPDVGIRYSMLHGLREEKESLRAAKLESYRTQTDKIAMRNKHHGAASRVLWDLYDDEGYEMVTEWIVKGVGRGYQAEHVERPGTRGGCAVAEAKLDALAQYLGETRMTRSDRLKVLEVFSRPRCGTQEAAALARIAAHGGDLDLSEAERAGTVVRYTPNLDTGLAHLVCWILEDSNEFTDSKSNKRKREALRSGEPQTREQLVDMGAILSALRLCPSAEPEPHQAYNGRYSLNEHQMQTVRLQLLKRWQDSTIVDVLMSEILHCPTKDEAIKQAKLFIHPPTESERRAMKKRYDDYAKRLLETQTQLREYYPANIVQVIKTDLLSLAPAKRKDRHDHLIRTAKLARDARGVDNRDTHSFAEVCAKYAERAARPEYFEKTGDSEYVKLGWFERMLNSISLDEVLLD